MATFHYRIVSYLELSPHDLEPHPAAALPIDAEDVASLDNSVAETGAVFSPLLVAAQPELIGGTRKRWIFEGINRQKTAIRLSLQKVPCLLVETSDPATLARQCAMAGRKKSTGMRVLLYCELHWDKLAEWRRFATAGSRDPVGKHRGFHPKKPDSLTPDEVAKHLHCAARDVENGIDLLGAIEAEEDAGRKAKLLGVRLNVLTGGTSIRKTRTATAPILSGMNDTVPANTREGRHLAAIVRLALQLGDARAAKVDFCAAARRFKPCDRAEFPTRINELIGHLRAVAAQLGGEDAP
ncbi:MAG: hypothetical protein FJ399_00455 [Verrucomicrobia bacterium]|nr:hypothetical protein [Verrucomicrobiota bacterium]